jgi:hypothetical protein
MEKLVLKCIPNSFGASNFMVDGKKVRCLTGYVPVEEVLKLSNEPNVRKVNPKAPVVKKIENTLTHQPEMMALRSLGITATADSCKVQGDNVYLNMKSIDGIINGGHNRHSIGVCKKKGVDLSAARIPVRILESKDLTNRDIASISTALNDSSEPLQSTLLEKKGLTSNMKSALKPEYVEKIEWVQNSMIGIPHISLNDFIMMLNLMDIKTYGGFKYNKSKRVSKGVKGVVSKVNDEVISYDYLAPVMNDILELYDTINTSLTRMVNAKGRNRIKDIEILCESQHRIKENQFGNQTMTENKTLFTNEPYVYNVNKGYMYVILSAFRANLNETVDGVEWVVPNVCEFFKSIERDIWSILVQNSMSYVEMKDGRKIADASASTKPKSLVWDSVYNLVSKEVAMATVSRVSRTHK